MSAAEVDLAHMRRAIALAHRSPPVATAYCVGAVLAAGPAVLATGFSRELPGNTHAEEVCLAKHAETPASAASEYPITLYTTMEPCSRRLSGRTPCAQRVIAAGFVRRVVVGAAEPPAFVADCSGIAELRAAGIAVVVLPELAADCLAPNAHVLG